MNSEDMKLRLLMQRSLRVFGIGIIALLIVLVVETGAAAYPTATDVNIQGSVWHWVPEKIVPVSGIGYSDYYPEYHLDADMGTFMMDTPFNSVSYIERYFDLSSDGSSLSLTVWGARNINGWCGDSVTVTVSIIDSGNITHQLGSFVPVQLDGGVGQGETKKFNISNFASQKVKIRIKQTSSGEHCTYGYYRDIAVIPASAQWGTPTQLTYNTASDYFPSITGDGSKIAFESYVDGDIDIFVINSDGTDLTQLTHNTALDRFPSTSGDGSKIAFASDVDGDWEIFVINSDGTGLTPLTSNIAWASCPSISGDGNKIAFVSGVPGDYEIFVINSDGTGLTQLTHNTALNLYPSISGDGSKIAFYSNVDGDYEIFVINSDGTGLTQLTHNTALDRGPSISDDGSKIAFYSYVDGDPEIVVINSDGTGLTQLTHNTAADFDPSISGDGNKIAFVSGVPDDAEIFVINSDGTGLTQLTSNTAEDGYPSINADGSKIAFCSDVDGDSEIFVVSRTPSILPKGKIAFASSRDGNQEVYVINADGSGHPTNLTNFPDADDGDPTWSPDGVQIAFSSNRSGHWKTYVMDADDGSNQVCLLEGVYDAWGPAWSPDGEEIAFAGQLSSDDDFEIYTMDIQSKALTQVTDNSDTDSHPAWSPNSHKIVFTSTRDDGNHELYVADLLAGTQTRLTDDPAYDDYPEWSPDGSMIVFVSGRDGNLEIYSMDIVSKAITRLTNNECTDKHAQWSPDGQNIVFISDRDGGDMDIYVMKADSTGIMCLVDWEGEETHPTWSSGHSSPPVYSVGQDAPTEAIKNHFIDAYNINGGITVLGNPTTTVHTAWGYLVQDFPGASCYTGGIIMYNPYKDYAYYIHGAIWDRYYSLGGPMAETDIEFELGLPISDIVPHVHTHPPAVSSHGTQFRYQNFEEGALDLNVDTGTVFEIHGTIFAKWRALGYAAGDLGLVTSDEQEAVISAIGTEGRVSDFEGGHIHWHRNGPYANTAFETHGAIDVVYCSEAGSGGWLGFPVSDEYVNPSGYAQSDFEGGYITTTDGVNYEAFVYTTNPPTNLAQFKSDSTTGIPVGGTTNERTVSFKGTVSDPDGDMVKLQVELRRLDEYGGQFDETKGGLKGSDFVASGSEAVAYGIELIDADYHWRVRAVDEHGDSSEWQEFGGNDISEADFWVLHTLPLGTIKVSLEEGTVDKATSTQGWNYQTKYNAPVFRRGIDNPTFMLTLDGPLPSNYECLYEIYSPNGANPIGSKKSSSSPGGCSWDWTDINGNLLNKDQIPIGIYTVKGYLVNKNNPEDRKIIGFDEFYVIFDFDKMDDGAFTTNTEQPKMQLSLFPYHMHQYDQRIWKLAIKWTNGNITVKEAVDKISELTRTINGESTFHHLVYDERKFDKDGYDNNFKDGADDPEENWNHYYDIILSLRGTPRLYIEDLTDSFLGFRTNTAWLYEDTDGYWYEKSVAPLLHPLKYVKRSNYGDTRSFLNSDLRPCKAPEGKEILEPQLSALPGRHPVGVCEDYAMLSTAYLRSIGIPAKMVITTHAWTLYHDNDNWHHLETDYIPNKAIWERYRYDKRVYLTSGKSDVVDGVSTHNYENGKIKKEDITNQYRPNLELCLISYNPDNRELKIRVEYPSEYSSDLALVGNYSVYFKVKEQYLLDTDYVDPEGNLYGAIQISPGETKEAIFTASRQFPSLSRVKTEAYVFRDSPLEEPSFGVVQIGDSSWTSVLSILQSSSTATIETTESRYTTQTESTNESINCSIVNMGEFKPGRTNQVTVSINNTEDKNATIGIAVGMQTAEPSIGVTPTPILVGNESSIETTAHSIKEVPIDVSIPNYFSYGMYELILAPYNDTGIMYMKNYTINITANYDINVSKPENVTVEIPFNLIVSIKNNDTEPICNLTAMLNLHYYFNTTESLAKDISQLNPDETHTFTWNLTPIDWGELGLDVEVYSDSGHDMRFVNINSLQTPKLWITAQVPEKVNKSDDFILNATIFNSGDIPSDSVTLNLTTPENVTANEQCAELGIIEAHENKTCSFRISQNESSDFMIILNATALNVTATGYAFITISQLPISYFTYEPQNPVVTQRITFNASNSTDPDGFITEYEWHFGDGNVTNTTEPIITHSYASTGDYTVNLTVTDDDGATNSTSKIITVTNLCGDVAPCPDCDGTVDMGDVILLLNNVSYPKNPRYVLCDDWAGDCRCTGVRDMGDVILLLNNVSYPENPIYALDCC